MKQYMYGFESYTIVKGNINEIGTISEININLMIMVKKKVKSL